MGAPLRIIDSALFIYFLIIAIAVPLIDGQTILPIDLYPKFLIELKSWFFIQIDHYLVFEMPYFYFGIAWFELLFQWPVALMCVYGIAGGKSWFGTTSLIYGSSFLASLAAILAELIGSKRASDKVLLPILGFCCSFLCTWSATIFWHIRINWQNSCAEQQEAGLDSWKVEDVKQS